MHNVCVVRFPDEKTGEVPLVWVILKPGMSATEEELQKLVQGQIINAWPELKFLFLHVIHYPLRVNSSL